MNPAPPAFQPLTGADAPSGFRLSSLAGWNQTEADWLRLARLCGNTSGVWRDAGEIRASFTVAPHGHAPCWIGMILVDPEYQGRGLGKAVFARALEVAAACGCAVVGLDATSMGEPIYRKHGFQPVAPTARWGGVPQIAGAPPPLPPLDRDAVLQTDRQLTGIDRSTLLSDLMGSREVRGWMMPKQGAGYAILRPGRKAWHLGPVIAPLAEDFGALLQCAAASLEGEPVVCDILEDSPSTAEILAAHGLQRRRQLIRMTAPLASDVLTVPAIRCGAGFEWG